MVNCYTDENKELATGDDYSYGAKKSFKRVKMGLIAYLSDRPEKKSYHWKNTNLERLDCALTGL